MIKFTQYTPYSINHDLILNTKLKSISELDDNQADKEDIPLTVIFGKIKDNKNEFSYDVNNNALNLSVGNDSFSFERDDTGGLLRFILDILSKVTFDDLLTSTWLFYEMTHELDFPQSFYYFFLCKGEDIINPSICISDDPFNKIPENVFEVVDFDRSEDMSALVRLCYENWMQNTTPGRIFAMKKKMDHEKEIAEEKEESIFESPIYESRINMIKEISLLRKDLGFIKLILIVIAVILVLIMINK